MTDWIKTSERGIENSPFDWWWSGRYWYCRLRSPSGKYRSGAGLTKPQAVEDARKELRKLEMRNSVRSAVISEGE